MSNAMATSDDDLPPGIDIGDEGDTTTRCWPETDAVATAGERSGRARWFCLPWAHGSCALGANCEQRHRLPEHADEIKLMHSADGLTHDIFGRARPEERGRTSQLADPFACATILVEHLPDFGTAGYAMQERRRCLEAFASEWGQAVKTWCLADPTSGYVKFRWRCSAQMCMEAMDGRPLRPDEATPLRLSWASSDPSLMQASQSRDLALAAMEEAAQRRLFQEDLYLKHERDIVPPKRRRLEPEGGDEVTAWMDAPERPLEGSMVAAEYPGGDPAYCAQAGADAAAAEEAGAEGGAQPLLAGWQSGIDPTYGATYFYHEESGRTQWQLPLAE